MSGANKGARVHTVLHYLRIPTYWKLHICEKGHNYAILFNVPVKTRAVILINQTSKRCYRIMYWNVFKNTIEYHSRKTPHQTALKINELMATTDEEPVSIEKGENQNESKSNVHR